MRVQIRRLLGRLFPKEVERKDKVEMLAENRKSEALLWTRIARSHPPGSDERDEARKKVRQRAQEARRLKNDAFLGGMNLRSRS